jgi:hypothetical protein
MGRQNHASERYAERPAECVHSTSQFGLPPQYLRARRWCVISTESGRVAIADVFVATTWASMPLLHALSVGGTARLCWSLGQFSRRDQCGTPDRPLRGYALSILHSNPEGVVLSRCREDVPNAINIATITGPMTKPLLLPLDTNHCCPGANHIEFACCSTT